MDRILIIDDEEHILELLDFNLSLEGYEVITTMSSLDGLDIIKQDKPDLVLLDWMLPKMSGIELLNIIRSDEDYDDIAVIMLTAKNMEEDKLEGLTIGADDYVTKPFSIKELSARVKNILKRYNKQDSNNKTNKIGSNKLKAGDLILELDRHEVYLRDRLIDLTVKEYGILKLLLENKGRVISREYILEKIWGYDYFGETRTVDVHIRYLRKKLGEDENFIDTIRGLGYKIK
ncbi:MAG: response regulator transcription factor [Peptostreptococcus sp.]|uniref:Stage 0 sporulation protein A homolog n=1 Tax=Peptostreptococcus anaerobius 653-L TaxID=596329 RepID=D3MRX5_9FIRM|nr:MULTISPECIES: response regulator transcription factor [Peptostreptococcus]EFD05135.1 response regulator receiver domain protein [Peptostreptococcus anaerobius 653-L]KXB72648.1 putative alkaline phosphatase synthesis transcriptional regulatory protein PhoP [Peptostreptococcus anaerobius]MCB6982033.1 response regulator transcription factor [Peptostreptococcus anaerobius]MCQ5149970.1 response regulator transcription factor [Peptostreptococcus anaerobius]MDB8849370.1 response regulator transcri